MSTPLGTVLVANRGEIARRVIRTLRRLGIRSVAVYSDADAGAPHVREADAAERIGPAAAADSYLSIEAVIAAAVRSSADAIHPGYGFLSENVDFARACESAGIVFVGPDTRALEVMGDKIRAKDHVAGSGVPIVPGFSAAGMAHDDIRAAAEDAGFPLLVKPSAGGGGKGMQVVRRAADLPDALAAARRVARSAFGDDTLLLERLIERPRHIEVQVLADAQGGVIHLGERECTLQRRHQKVIEESPSPIVDPVTRARLGEAACAAAASVDYRGAGTVEFLVAAAQPDEFFFIEMNTRLQVEHPVTELVTGIDLVEQQLRVAAGERLALTQDDVRISGHAIEARVYAEDPARGFLPSTGRVLAWEEPSGVRTDAAVETGSHITADYDPMIAKVIAHAPARAEALGLLDAALAETVALGVDTNVGFLRTLLADPSVQAGDLDTGLIDRLPPFSRPEPGPVALRAAAASGDGLLRARESTSAAGSAWTDGEGWRLGAPGVPRTVRVLTEAGRVKTVPAPAIRPQVFADGRGWAAVAPGRALESGATIAGDDGGWLWVHAHGATHRLRPLSRREATLRRVAEKERRTSTADPDVRAPMPGAVVAVHVEDGAVVDEGERLLTIEAMKMEHVVVAGHAGTVALTVAVGDQVRRDQSVARVTPAGDPG